MTGTLFLTALLFAADIYVVQGQATGPIIGQEMILWSTDALFFNAGSDTARVQLRGTSNGVAAPLPPTAFDIAPHRSASLGQEVGNRWHLGSPTIWVHHLDVTGDVITENLLFLGAMGTSTGIGSPFKYGKVHLPIVHALTPPGQPQVHLGTYLGISAQIPSRINVAIYNAAAMIASAHIEVRNVCDDSLIDAKEALIPADTILQVSGFRNEGSCPESTPIGGPPQAVYTIVTVDQPSFSFVSTLANNTGPITSMSITN